MPYKDDEELAKECATTNAAIANKKPYRLFGTTGGAKKMKN